MLKPSRHRIRKSNPPKTGAKIANILSENEIAVNSETSGATGWVAGVISVALVLALIVVGSANAQTTSQFPSTQAAPQSSTQNPQQAPAQGAQAPAPEPVVDFAWNFAAPLGLKEIEEQSARWQNRRP